MGSVETQTLNQGYRFSFVEFYNIIFQKNTNQMFDKFENQTKADHFINERTADRFGETQDDSFAYEVEAEKGYVSRLKLQRQKIENLYSRYDVLLKDLKSKDMQIKEKDKTITNLEAKCKTLTFVSQETSTFKQQNHSIKSENQTLQKAIAELQQSYAVLHGQFRSKEAITSQKYDEMEHLNDQLMSKLRSLTKKYQEREEEFGYCQKELTQRFQEFKLQAKKEREAHVQEIEILKTANMQKEEQNRVLKTESQCLKERVVELQSYINEMTFENEQKFQHIHKQRKCQVRALKSEIQHLKELNTALQKKWNKMKEECQLKQISLHEMTLLIDQHDKESSQAIQLLRYQYNQQKTALKQQLVYCQNHISKLQRKIADMARKQQNLYGKIKKYQVTIDAKRNLREIEKEQLQKINMLLNLH